MKTIITHGGKAHFDDFAAVALILACNPADDFEICRRDPTPEDMENPEIWVVDIGRQHCPEKKKFDHHQYQGGECAFVLVARHFGIWDGLNTEMPQMAFKSVMDTRGPQIAAAYIGLQAKDLINMLSPLETAVLADFGASATPEPGLPRAIGNYWLKAAADLKQRLEDIRLIAVVEPLGDEYGYMLVLDEVCCCDSMFGVSAFKAEWEAANPGKIITVSVTPEKARISGDVPGKNVYRFDDFPLIDFSRLKGMPGVKFTHKSGFLAIINAGISLRTVIDTAKIGASGRIKENPLFLTRPASIAASA